jgi:hypothetical protein
LITFPTAIPLQVLHVGSRGAAKRVNRLVIVATAKSRCPRRAAAATSPATTGTTIDIEAVGVWNSSTRMRRRRVVIRGFRSSTRVHAAQQQFRKSTTPSLALLVMAAAHSCAGNCRSFRPHARASAFVQTGDARSGAPEIFSSTLAAFIRRLIEKAGWSGYRGSESCGRPASRWCAQRALHRP